MKREGTTKRSPPVVHQDGIASSAGAKKAGVGGRGPLSSRAKDLVRRALSNFVDYRFNWIVAQDERSQAPGLSTSLEVRTFDKRYIDALAQHPDPRVRSALSFERAGCTGFVLLADAEPAAFLHFADVSRYESASTWPLASNEVALVNVITLPAYRSRGYASLLIAEATSSLVPKSYQRAIAYIWWNHEASLRAFRNAGWRRIGISIEISRGNGRWHSVHIPLKLRR